MNEETYKALKEVVSALHRELNKIKKVDNKYHDLVNLSVVESWIDESAKEYQTFCHLCGSVEQDHYCTNKSCCEAWNRV